MAEVRRRYRAFVSYSQRDKRHARRLHRALEAYRVPKGVDALIEANTRKLGRIFRDDEEMGAASHLGAALEGAIADSENLVVVASPHAAGSEWVNEEILHFKRTGRAENIFAVIVDGVPNASASDDPIETERECFPPALRFETDQNGTLTDCPAEPFGVDLRKEPFARVRARLVAGMLRVPFDTLWRRDRRRARRRGLWTAAGIVVAITAIVGTLGATVVLLERQASLDQSATLTTAANAAVDQGHNARALRLAVLATRESWLTRTVAESEAALARAAHHAYQSIELVGHERPVTRMMLSPDGKRVLSAGGQTVRVWNADNGAELRRFTVDAPGVYATFTSQGKQVLTWGVDQTARVWDVVSGAEIARHSHDGIVTYATLDSAGERGLSLDSDGVLHVWDAATGAEISRMDHGSIVLGARFAPDGKHVLSWGDFGAWLWQVDTGVRVTRMKNRRSVRVNVAQFTPDATRVVSFGSGRAVSVWAVDTGASLLELSFADDVIGASIVDDGARVLAWSRDGAVRIWDLRTGDTIAGHDHGAPVAGAVMWADGSKVLSWSQTGEMRIWNVGDGRVVVREVVGKALRGVVADTSSGRILYWSADQVRVWDTISNAIIASFSHDNAVIAAAFDDTGTRVLAWDLGAAFIRRIAPVGQIGGHQHEDSVLEAKMTSDGAQVLSRELKGNVHLWNAKTGALVARIVLADDARIQGDEISPDGTRALAWDDSGTVRLWDLASGIELARRHYGQGKRKRHANAVFSPDGARVLSWERVTAAVDLWDAATGVQIARFAALGGAFSADGSRIVIWAFDGTTTVRNAHDGVSLATRENENRVTKARFSPNGARVLLWSGGAAHVWDVARDVDIASHDHDGIVSDAVFGPDGSLVLSQIRDGPAHLWNAVSGERIPLRTETDRAGFQAAFVAAGAMVLTWALDGGARLANAKTGAEKARVSVDRRVIRRPTLSADAKRLVTVGDGVVSVWQLDAPETALSMHNHGPSRVSGAAFLGGGARVVSWDERARVFVWDAETGAVIARLDHGGVFDVSMSPTTDRIVTAGLDGWARVWDVHLAAGVGRRDLLRIVCEEQLAGPDFPLARPFVNTAGQRVNVNSLRRITRDDAANDAAPILADRIGEDVCSPLPSWWAELRRAIAHVFAGGG